MAIGGSTMTALGGGWCWYASLYPSLAPIPELEEFDGGSAPPWPGSSNDPSQIKNDPLLVCEDDIYDPLMLDPFDNKGMSWDEEVTTALKAAYATILADDEDYVDHEYCNSTPTITLLWNDDEDDAFTDNCIVSGESQNNPHLT